QTPANASPAAWETTRLQAEAGPRTGGLPEQPGRCLGDYELLGEIGRGGMGVVYKARQRSLGRLVALKMIQSVGLVAAAEAQRFRNEAEMSAHLDHPNIVPVHEVGEQEGQLYFSMKLVEGGSLDQHRAHFGSDLKSAARLVSVIARAVHHAH